MMQRQSRQAGSLYRHNAADCVPMITAVSEHSNSMFHSLAYIIHNYYQVTNTLYNQLQFIHTGTYTIYVLSISSKPIKYTAYVGYYISTPC